LIYKTKNLQIIDKNINKNVAPNIIYII